MATARFIALALLGPAVGAMGSSTLPPRGSVLAAARARFACKAFDPARPLPPAALRYLADAALAAPSSFNAQPWRCVLVTSAEAREKLAGGMLAANGKRVREAPLVAVFTSDLRACGRARAVAALTALGGAPAGFVKALPFYVSLFSSGYRLAVLKWPMFWAKQVALWLVSFVQASPKISTPETWAFKQTMPAVTHLMLAAAEQGLASLPMEGFDESRVRAALGIPRRYAVPCVVAVGYATEGAAGAARAGRFELAEMFAADRFETPWTPTLAAE